MRAVCGLASLRVESIIHRLPVASVPNLVPPSRRTIVILVWEGRWTHQGRLDPGKLREISRVDDFDICFIFCSRLREEFMDLSIRHFVGNWVKVYALDFLKSC